MRELLPTLLIMTWLAACKHNAQSSHCQQAPIRIPAGDFYMGCDNEDLCSADEAPAHRVAVPAFEIDSCEVTVEQYEQCVKAGVCSAPQNYSPQCNYGISDRKSHPINCVTAEQAQTYCQYVGMRLCTEAEWEKAARGGCELYQDCLAETPLYPWGSGPPTCDKAVFAQCSARHTLPVGTRPAGASPYGVLDMAGNVWEWVADTYHGSYDGAPTDGTAWLGGTERVFRGASFLSPAQALRATNRSHMAPNLATDALGFRCCRATPPSPQQDAWLLSDEANPGEDSPTEKDPFQLDL